MDAGSSIFGNSMSSWKDSAYQSLTFVVAQLYQTVRRLPFALRAYPRVRVVSFPIQRHGEQVEWGVRPPRIERLEARCP
jgi:hypothetical protein